MNDNAKGFQCREGVFARGACPVEEIQDELVVVLYVHENPDEVVGVEARLVRLENAAKGLGTASFDGGGDVAHEVGVCDGGFSRGVIREWSGSGC